VRGLLAIEVLARLEQCLATASGVRETRLADHFDLVAGTSAGAIVAGAIALGISMREVRDFITSNAAAMLRPAGWSRRLLYWYDKQFLSAHVKEWFGEDTTLGSDRLRTLVLLLMRNVSTDSPWLVSSNPRAPFNQRTQDDCNLDLKLWQLALASAAAPAYFEPEVVTFGRARSYRSVYVDGALTGFNNPAFKAFLYATTEPYGLNWPASEEKLLILSVGTGLVRHRDPALQPRRMYLWYTARETPRALIYAADREQDLLCRTFGCLMGDAIDLEVGDLRTARTAVARKLFTYFRINAPLSREGLAALGCVHIDPAHVEVFDQSRYVNELREVGEKLAERTVGDELLEWFKR